MGIVNNLEKYSVISINKRVGNNFNSLVIYLNDLQLLTSILYYLVSRLSNDLKMVMLSDFLRLLGNPFQFSAPV